ncbi:MAG: hypothetical protein J6M05_04385 [Cardiobacteriaceae bacterium]|nr:hypothetical protein [Cardiobacteriaceae bacterium]
MKKTVLTLALAAIGFAATATFTALPSEANPAAKGTIVYLELKTGRYYNASYQPLPKGYKPNKFTRVKRVNNIKPLRQQAHIKQANSKQKPKPKPQAHENENPPNPPQASVRMHGF